MENGMEQAVNPSHYGALDGSDVDCARAAEAMLGPGALDFWQGLALKYLWRWQRKNGVEDLCKAKRCIDKAIELAERQ